MTVVPLEVEQEAPAVSDIVIERVEPLDVYEESTYDDLPISENSEADANVAEYSEEKSDEPQTDLGYVKEEDRYVGEEH